MDIKTQKQIADAASKLIHGFSVPALADREGWADVAYQAHMLAEHADALAEGEELPAAEPTEGDG